MGEDPGQIRQEIEVTRAQMGDTVEALSYKTDVKARAKDSVTDKVAAVRSKVGLALGAVAAGFIAGLLVPATRVEDEKLGEVSDQVIEKAKETGQEAMERGKEVAQQAAQSAKETAQQSGRQHADELKQSAQESAQEVSSS